MKTVISSLAALGAVLLMAMPASANGAGASSFTVTFQNQSFGPMPAGPCTPAGSLVSGTENAIFHTTTLANGTFWTTGTITGQANIVTPAGVTYTGHFAIWFGDNNNLNNGAETSIFEAQLKAPDGSILDIHGVAHLSVSANGQVNFFMDFTC